MKAVLQRVRRATINCSSGKEEHMSTGLLVLLGIHRDDQEDDVRILARKIPLLRLFPDEAGVNNLSLIDLKQNGLEPGILLVSQFTLHADTSRGRRPYYGNAAAPEQAIPLYELAIDLLSREIAHVASGVFGDDMQIQLHADGPVTIILDSILDRRKSR